MINPHSRMQARRYDIDNLRNLAVFALIPFHTARLFNDEPWHIKDAHVYSWADTIVHVINEWHMPLFFVLAGMSLHFALRAHGAARVVRERFLRLFVPFALGCVLFVAPQVYIERISGFVALRYDPQVFSGSYLDFLPTFFTTGAYPQGNFSWHHLWFVIYLFVYAVLAAPVLAAAESGRWTQAAGRMLARYGLFLIAPAVVVAVVAITLYPVYPSTHGLFGDWANHVHFGFLFLLGWLIAAVDDLGDAFLRHRRFALALAAGTFVVSEGGALAGLDGALFTSVRPIVWALGEWLWIAAFLGYARTGLDRRIPWLTGFTRYAFPFYILHQTVIVLLGYALYDWQSAAFAKFLVICAAATAISLAGCRLFDTTVVLRVILGIKGVRTWAPRPAVT